MGRGLGYIDIHLLASALLSSCQIWTNDRTRVCVIPLKIGEERNRRNHGSASNTTKIEGRKMPNVPTRTPPRTQPDISRALHGGRPGQSLTKRHALSEVLFGQPSSLRNSKTLDGGDHSQTAERNGPQSQELNKIRGRPGSFKGKSYFLRESRNVTAPWGQVTSKYSKFSRSFWSVTDMAILMEFIAAKA